MEISLVIFLKNWCLAYYNVDREWTLYEINSLKFMAQYVINFFK